MLPFNLTVSFAAPLVVRVHDRFSPRQIGLLIMAGLLLLAIIPAGSLPPYKPGEIPA